jgi:Tol biopolymer transport system component
MLHDGQTSGQQNGERVGAIPGRHRSSCRSWCAPLDPAISPDGKQIVYAAGLDGAMRIYVRQRVGAERSR